MVPHWITCLWLCSHRRLGAGLLDTPEESPAGAACTSCPRLIQRILEWVEKKSMEVVVWALTVEHSVLEDTCKDLLSGRRDEQGGHVLHFDHPLLLQASASAGRAVAVLRLLLLLLLLIAALVAAYNTSLHPSQLGSQTSIMPACVGSRLILWGGGGVLKSRLKQPPDLRR